MDRGPLKSPPTLAFASCKFVRFGRITLRRELGSGKLFRRKAFYASESVWWRSTLDQFFDRLMSID